jgi:hypothetical protein
MKPLTFTGPMPTIWTVDVGGSSGSQAPGRRLDFGSHDLE